MAEVWIDYCNIILEFLFEIYVFYGLVCFRLNRSGHFIPKAVLGLLVVILIAFPVAFLYSLFGNTVWGRAVRLLRLPMITTKK